MLTVETEELSSVQPEEIGLSFVQSYVRAQIIGQLLENRQFKPLPSLTLDVGDGLTPHLSVYLRADVKPNYWKDIEKFSVMPLIVIEIATVHLPINRLFEQADLLVANGVRAVWIVEPAMRSIAVIAQQSKQFFQNQTVASEGVAVDFRRIFSDS